MHVIQPRYSPHMLKPSSQTVPRKEISYSCYLLSYRHVVPVALARIMHCAPTFIHYDLFVTFYLLPYAKYISQFVTTPTLICFCLNL